MLSIFNGYLLFFLGFFLSFSIALLIYKTKNAHIAFSNDTTNGSQKFHTDNVPRIGGIALYLSTLIFAVIRPDDRFFFEFVISVTPIFLTGLWEDFSKNVSSWLRLLASFVSAYFLVLHFGHSITGSGISFVDRIVDWLSIWKIITIIVVVTVINSLNIIDGFNGLASGASIITFATMGILAAQNGDHELVAVIALMVLVILGFFVVNFPKGLIFLGDGGAYFCGFAISFISIFLLERNPEIEPTILFVILAYPLIEIIFSIFRKTLRKGHRPDRPDRLHFHMLLYRKLRTSNSTSFINTNAKTGIYLQLIPLSGTLFVFFDFNDKTYNLLYFIGVSLIYLRLYRKFSLNG